MASDLTPTEAEARYREAQNALRAAGKAPYDVWAAAARAWIEALCDWNDAVEAGERASCP